MSLEEIGKTSSLRIKAADAAADIGLINRFAVRELTPDEVFCFSVVLCNNEVDRDLEAFTVKSLQEFAEMFVGKTIISDHRWHAGEQFARLYALEVQDGDGTTKLGEGLKNLVGRAYMLRTEGNREKIAAIEAGILKEVSIGGRTKRCACSICDKDLRFDWRSWTEQCETGHIKGQEYDGKLCVGRLDGAEDAFELSFVAVPAQPGAGVTKDAGAQLAEALELVIAAPELERHPRFAELVKAVQRAGLDSAERAERQKLLEENAAAVGRYCG